MLFILLITRSGYDFASEGYNFNIAFIPLLKLVGLN